MRIVRLAFSPCGSAAGSAWTARVMGSLIDGRYPVALAYCWGRWQLWRVLRTQLAEQVTANVPAAHGLLMDSWSANGALRLFVALQLDKPGEYRLPQPVGVGIRLPGVPMSW